MGKNKGNKKRKSSGAGAGFQVVAEGGSAVARATSKGGLGGGAESDSDDDTAAIRKANAAAGAKRQKQADAKAAKAAAKEGGGERGETKMVARGSKAKEVAKKAVQKGGKPVSGSGVKGNKEEATRGKGKKGRRAEEEEEEDDDEAEGVDDAGMEEDSSSEEELSDEGDDEDQGAGLQLKPGAYAEQRKGGRNEFDEDSGEGSDFEELQVVFDNMYPQEKDFHGIKACVTAVLVVQHWGLCSGVL